MTNSDVKLHSAERPDSQAGDAIFAVCKRPILPDWPICLPVQHAQHCAIPDGRRRRARRAVGQRGTVGPRAIQLQELAQHVSTFQPRRQDRRGSVSPVPAGQKARNARPAATMAHGCVSGGVRRVWDGLARAPGALRGGFTTAGCPRCQRPGAASCPGCRECRECRWREAGRAAGRGHAARRSRPRYSGIPGIRCSPPPGPGRRGHFTSAKTKAKCPRLPSKTLKDPPHSQGNAPMAHRCCGNSMDGPWMLFHPAAEPQR